jgi:hypothetical protein
MAFSFFRIHQISIFFALAESDAIKRDFSFRQSQLHSFNRNKPRPPSSGCKDSVAAEGGIQ